VARSRQRRRRVPARGKAGRLRALEPAPPVSAPFRDRAAAAQRGFVFLAAR
jgi:hypothetical protein